MDKRNLFLGEYVGSTYEDVVEDITYNYEVERQTVDEYQIVIAILNDHGYEEDSYFLMVKSGKLYENFAGHCSCMGFEGQFQPEETTVDYLMSKQYTNRDDTEIMNFLRSGILRSIFREKKLKRIIEKESQT